MSKTLKSLAFSLPVLSFALATSLSATPKKEAYQCVDASGKEVVGTKTKKDCAAPNKWTKASDKSSAMKAGQEAPKSN
ncbi:MAG: hypothetical protein NTX25_20045 [Proteobacteria bacterium]|nr:hypothetical protein [Pseudomonadota bacterium]